MKRFLVYIVVAGVLGIVGLMGVTIYQKLLEAEEVLARIGELPELEAVALNKHSSNQSLSGKPTIISYINTNCRFCLAEIESIRQHPNLLTDARIVLISDEPKRRLELFASSFGLDTLSIEMFWDSSGTVKSLYGIKGVPSTFVYSGDQQLLEQFYGETNADILYEFLR
jgi:peroxiredoxin